MDIEKTETKPCFVLLIAKEKFNSKVRQSKGISWKV